VNLTKKGEGGGKRTCNIQSLGLGVNG
jgi:hypothetical protein